MKNNMTMAEAMAFMNEAFGNPEVAKDNPAYWTRVLKQTQIMFEEAKETLEKGAEAKNMQEVRDGIADVLVTILGLAHIAGIPAEEDMDAVLESNLSKICKDIDSVMVTRAKYLDLGLRTYMEPSTAGGYVVKVDGDQKDNGGKFFPDGKFLKCAVGYKEPVFTPLEHNFLG